MTDETALDILFRTYWSGSRWERTPGRAVTREEHEYAVGAGVMFEPVCVSHDKIVEWVCRSRERLSLEEVVDGFLASLSTRRLELRSGLGSYAIALNFPKHPYDGAYSCRVCGEYERHGRTLDLGVLSFERYKWGGVRHLDPHYIAFDLERFCDCERLVPTLHDIQIMRRIINIASSLRPEARPRDLERALVGVLASNKEEREILIQILGYSGILQPKGFPGFFRSFVNFSDRRDRPDAWKIDWEYPISWWQGRDGVTPEALHYFFPQLDRAAA